MSISNVTPLFHARAESSVSRRAFWGGWVMSGFSALFLLLDGAMKEVKPAPVVQATAKLGYPGSVLVPLGVVLLASTVLYLIPRTAVLGAILLTGYLGGAVASHVRVGDPLFSHTLFPTYLGLLLWGGLCLRDERVRAPVPLRGVRACVSGKEVQRRREGDGRMDAVKKPEPEILAFESGRRLEKWLAEKPRPVPRHLGAVLQEGLRPQDGDVRRSAGRGVVLRVDRRAGEEVRRGVLPSAIHPPPAQEPLVQVQPRSRPAADRGGADEAGGIEGGRGGQARRPVGVGVRPAEQECRCRRISSGPAEDPKAACLFRDAQPGQHLRDRLVPPDRGAKPQTLRKPWPAILAMLAEGKKFHG